MPRGTLGAILWAAIVIVLRVLHLMGHATPMSTFSIMSTPTEEVIEGYPNDTEYTISYMLTSFK